jgi:hypothetical protein
MSLVSDRFPQVAAADARARPEYIYGLSPERLGPSSFGVEALRTYLQGFCALHEGDGTGTS